MKRMDSITTIWSSLLMLCLLSSSIIAEDQTEKINGLIDMLSSNNEEAIVEAIRELVRIGEPAIPILIQRLKAIDLKNQFLQSSALLTTLKEIGEPAVEPLIELLQKSPRIETIKSTMVLLGRIGDARATPYIIKKLKHPDAEVRGAAVLSLGDLQDKRAIRPLLDSLSDSEFYVEKDKVAWALGLICGTGDRGSGKTPIMMSCSMATEIDASVDTLIGLLNNSNPSTRVRAAISLGQIGNPKAVNSLIEILQSDKEVSVRRAAIEGLSMIKDSRVVSPLLEAMKDKDLKWQVVNVLHRVEDERAVDALIELSKDKESYWRYEAVIALGKIKSSKAKKALREALKDPEIQGVARRILSESGE